DKIAQVKADLPACRRPATRPRLTKLAPLDRGWPTRPAHRSNPTQVDQTRPTRPRLADPRLADPRLADPPRAPARGTGASCPTWVGLLLRKATTSAGAAPRNLPRAITRSRKRSSASIARKTRESSGHVMPTCSELRRVTKAGGAW